ncbi:MAG: signal peptidase I [Gammaproteobacteria bacterium]
MSMSEAPEQNTFWEEWRGFIVFIVLMFAFRIAIADWNHVPSGSMRPTLIEGDRIWLNKLAYDVKVPYTNIVLKKVSDPQRGDIIVFISPKDRTRLVKRIVGIPGDRVSYDRHQMRLNGEPLVYEPLPFEDVDESVKFERAKQYELYTEKLPDNPHPVLHAPRSRTPEQSWVVPEGQYLTFGDNRDQSDDSRFWGFVPRQLIIGRTSSVVMSFNPDNYYIPRGSRFFKSLP